MKQVGYFSHLAVLLVIFAGMARGLPAQSALPEQIPLQLERFQNSLQAQKLFIHFDKQHYVAGETMWFKGYLVEATDHLPHPSSANVYLELWNVRGEKVLELICQPSHGIFYGQIDIDPGLPDGNYVIRAYTDHMLNLGESFLFYKYFYISNPDFANSIDNDTRQFNRDFNETLDALHQNLKVQFFPEGGSLITGLESRLGIKVTDQAGNGIIVKGNIQDDLGKIHAQFETNHAGIGIFSIKPESGRQYMAQINSEREGKVVRPLPLALDKGYTLNAAIEGGMLIVTVSYAPLSIQPPPSLLVAHSRGKTVFVKSGILIDSSQVIQIPLSNFPTGISHITLFSNDLKPVAERLVFVNHDDQIYFDISARIFRSGDANALNIEVLATDFDGKPIEGNFSVAVQYGNVGDRSHHENIFSYLLMSSELKEPVAQPVFYFDALKDPEGAMVDHLMLTQTWQRFSWEDVTNPALPVIQFTPSYGATISGRLTAGEQGQLGVGDTEVQMRLIEDPLVTAKTRTNTDGKFSFGGLSVAEGSLVEIIPSMIAGRQLPEVKLNTSARIGEGVKPFTYTPNLHTLRKKITDRGNDWRRPSADRPGRTTTVSGQLFGTPDQTIYISPDEPYSKVIDVLRDKVRGLTVSPSGFITMGGVTSIMHQSQPLFFVDGIESQVAFLGTHPREIERIEIFRGASTAVFGARGAAGALVAYTRQHAFELKAPSQNIFSVAGLHVPRQFIQETQQPVSFDMLYPVKTAFWEPNLITDPDGKANFSLLTIAGVTQYRIVIQGVGNNGKVGFAEFVIGN